MLPKSPHAALERLTIIPVANRKTVPDPGPSASHFPAPFVYSTVLRFVQFPSSFPLHIVAFHFLLAPGFRSPPVARLASASDVSRIVHFGVAHLGPLLHALGHFDRSAGASRLVSLRGSTEDFCFHYLIKLTLLLCDLLVS